MPQTAYTSLADFYFSSEINGFPVARRQCSSNAIQLVKLRRSAHELAFPAVPELVLGLVLDGTFPFHFDFGSGWSASTELRPGDVRICAPNTEARYRCGGDYTLLLLCLPEAPIGEVLRREFDADLDSFAGLAAQTALRDDLLRMLAQQIWAESVHDDPATAFLVEGLVQSLVAQLVRRSRSNLDADPLARRASPVADIETSRFTARLHRVHDYIEAHIDQPLSVAELAAVATMSRSHFARTFKAMAGESVWAHVRRRRCERARDLLRFTREPIALIAHRSGFASQSHLTSSFKRAFGVTPAAFRRDLA